MIQLYMCAVPDFNSTANETPTKQVQGEAAVTKLVNKNGHGIFKFEALATFIIIM